MTLDDLLDRLASFQPTGFPFISLYLDARADENGRAGYDSFVRKELAERAKTYAAGSSERESFDSDAARITTYLAEEREPSANGMAIFACAAADGFFEAAQLGAPIERNRLFVFDQPHLYPLARLMDQYPRYAVLVASTNQARILVFGRGKTLDSEEIEGVKTNRTKVGGWSQMRYQRHLANYHLHHAKEVVETLDRVVREDAARHVILAGDDVIMPILREQLPAHLTELVIETMKLDINTPEHEILSTTLEHLRDHDAGTDTEKVSRLFDEYRAGGLGVVGVENTLAALVHGQVEELLIDAKPAEIEYSETKVERVLEAYETDAAATGIDTSETRVVADELIRRAQSSGARVTFIEDASLLTEVGGVGALLRYPMAVAYSDNAQRIVATPGTANATAEDTEGRPDLFAADTPAATRTAPDNSDIRTEETKTALVETRTFRDTEAKVEGLEVRVPAAATGNVTIKLLMRDGEVRELTDIGDADALDMTSEELARVKPYTVLRKPKPAPRIDAELSEPVAEIGENSAPRALHPQLEASGDGRRTSLAQAAVIGSATSGVTTPNDAIEDAETADATGNEEAGIVETLEKYGEQIEDEVKAFVDRIKSIFSG